MVDLMATQEYLHAKPQYEIVLDGRDITSSVNTRLMNLTLSESRGEEADKLDITLDDSDGRLPMPGKGSKIALKLGWAGHGLVDKGCCSATRSTTEDRTVRRSGTSWPNSAVPSWRRSGWAASGWRCWRDSSSSRPASSTCSSDTLPS